MAGILTEKARKELFNKSRKKCFAITRLPTKK